MFVFAQVFGGGSNGSSFIELCWRLGEYHIDMNYGDNITSVLSVDGVNLNVDDDLNVWVTWQLTW